MLFISLILSLESSLKTSLCIENLLSLIASNFFGVKSFKASTCFFPLSSIVFICFSKVLPIGE